MPSSPENPPATLELRRREQTLEIHLGGDWRLAQRLPATQEVFSALASATVQDVRFECGQLNRWGSALLILVRRVQLAAAPLGAALDLRGLPAGAQRLLATAGVAAVSAAHAQPPGGQILLERLGREALAGGAAVHTTLSFLGEVALSLGRFFQGRARMRGADLLLHIQEAGAQALPIVSLISVLVGLILAFVGAVQLSLFGAQIYIADAVGLGMARDMGAMMTGIIMAGRTGAAYAAQLGAMQVNEEIDALTTFGISPMDYLVLPRLLALALMMPLLTIYADVMGILGGALAAVSLFDITTIQYYQQTLEAVPLRHFAAGLIKSLAYGLIVAVCGCLYGMVCGRSASAVGVATTRAVVSAIVWIVVSCAVLTLIFYVLGI